MYHRKAYVFPQSLKPFELTGNLLNSHTSEPPLLAVLLFAVMICPHQNCEPLQQNEIFPWLSNSVKCMYIIVSKLCFKLWPKENI